MNTPALLVRLLAMLVVTGVSAHAAWAQPAAPAGFRLPGEADYVGNWRDYRAAVATPFLAEADFNNDGVADEVWLLPASQGPGWGLFAFLGARDGAPRVVRLDDNAKMEVQAVGIVLAKAGRHTTVCGKGYWACEGEPAVLDLALPAVEFFQFESAASIFWWDRQLQQFRRTWTRD